MNDIILNNTFILALPSPPLGADAGGGDEVDSSVLCPPGPLPLVSLGMCCDTNTLRNRGRERERGREGEREREERDEKRRNNVTIFCSYM